MLLDKSLLLIKRKSFDFAVLYKFIAFTVHCIQEANFVLC